MKEKQYSIEETLEIMIQYKKRGGLVPTAVQDADTLEVLKVGYVNQIALQKTLETGLATFWSTSRDELWVKGETSGDKLRVKEILVDCDQDALVYKVDKLGGGVCHTDNGDGKARLACFYRKITDGYKLEFLPGRK